MLESSPVTPRSGDIIDCSDYVIADWRAMVRQLETALSEAEKKLKTLRDIIKQRDKEIAELKRPYARER